jgi:hypothetical protein
MDTTKLVAFYGALVSTFTVGWNVYRDFHDRARIKLSTMLGYKIKNGDRTTIFSHGFAIEEWPDKFRNAAPSIFLTITNTGRRSVTVENWAICTDRKKTGKDNFLYPLTVLPKALKEGEYAVEYTNDLSLLTDGATKIYAWDTTGKKWLLPRRALRKLQREVQNVKVEECPREPTNG